MLTTFIVEFLHKVVICLLRLPIIIMASKGIPILNLLQPSLQEVFCIYHY